MSIRAPYSRKTLAHQLCRAPADTSERVSAFSFVIFFVRSACFCLTSWDRKDARTPRCVHCAASLTSRCKKFAGGETIDLQSQFG
jgi:hypothetical protein